MISTVFLEAECAIVAHKKIDTTIRFSIL